MKKRIFLRKEGKNYIYKYDGEDKEWKADPTTWKVYKLKESLLESGAGENELTELLELKYEEGFTEAEVECRR